MTLPGRILLPSLLAGVLVAGSLPPWGFWPLAFAGIALLAARLHGVDRARTRALAGLAFSFGQFGPTLFWISEFHLVGYVALLFLEGAFFVAALVVTRRIVLLPATFVLAEWARGEVPFGGLPMGGLPLGQAAGPLAPIARLGGAYLLTGAAVAIGVGMALAVQRRWRPAALLVAVPLALAAVGVVGPAGAPEGEPISIAIVQGGGPRGYRAVDSDPGGVLDAHLRVSEDLDGPLDLVLWPENAIDVDGIAGTAEEAVVSAIAARLGATVVAGVTEDAGRDNFRNVAYVWGPDGRLRDGYTKVNRVPFGEYVPLRGFLERFVDLSVLPRDAVSGKGAGILRTPAGDFGVAISYEVFFGERGRTAANAGAQLLLVPTNAASFTTSQVPTQEIAAAQLRAWETGRWVLMSAPTGYGAVIDDKGRVLDRTVLGAAQLLEGEARLRSGRTIYAILGDLPIVVLAGLAALFGLDVRRRRRSEVMQEGLVRAVAEAPRGQ